jgi:ATP-dependent Lhr-like helicase
MNQKTYLPEVLNWFHSQGWNPLAFQSVTWEHCLSGKSGLLNAPTGTGKTYALFIGAVLTCLQGAENGKKSGVGLQIIWITPIRALSRDIANACVAFIEGIGLSWKVAVRTGDTETKERERQKRNAPEVLITTPESLHLIMASKGYESYLSQVKFVVADEWHELMGTKRAVMLELALCRIKVISKPQIWGISATIGNLSEAMEVLLGNDVNPGNKVMVRAGIEKNVTIIPIIPDEIEKYPRSGHLGTKLAPSILPIIESSKSTLVFTNTRSQAEMWYQKLLELKPELAGLIAMHHGSISRELRDWVEDGLHAGRLKCVVCTSSLDLGVDFRPVETIVQVGSPKGVARFLQRAGRSGHHPGAESIIYFLPANSLQLLECAALKQAIANGDIESRIPYIRSFDVLIQFLITLAVSDGFEPQTLLNEIRSTFSFASISNDEWEWIIQFITSGGGALQAYDEYRKVEILPDGRFMVTNRSIAMRHRLSIGAIISDTMLQVKFQSGGYLGTIEEWFISSLSAGDTFWFAGRPLELIRLKEMTVQVRLSKNKNANFPSWMGGRMPLSAMLSENLRHVISRAMIPGNEKELLAVQPLLNTQLALSALPSADELLIENITTRDGYHVYVYPFEGRFVHEGMASLLAYRLSLFKPISFSIALNDYGFELLSDQPIPIEDAIDSNIFSTEHLMSDLQSSTNHNEMARRRFRDIAGIAGLVFKGFPGKYQKDKHLQSSSQLFFDVFRDFERNNLLYKQAYQEVMEFQLEEVRLRAALKRISGQKVIITYPTKPTPFCFPIMYDRLREKFSNEKLEDKIKKMALEF